MQNEELTLQQLMTESRGRLAQVYGQREAGAMVDEMLLRIKGWDRVQTIIHSAEPVSDFVRQRVDETTRRLLDGEPIQYIFGKAHFYGMDFTVTPATLIPRPETAQLVDMIVDRYGDRRDLRVLDLGTGSGCIAIALARNLQFPKEVVAVDISPEALKVARENSVSLRTKILTVEADMLSEPSLDTHVDGKFDIIVCNPPYIARHEAAGMERHVTDHEPELALFVPDDDPLLFYRAIARFAGQRLEAGGTLFLEINPLFVKDLEATLRSFGFTDLDVVKDMQKADRFIIARR